MAIRGDPALPDELIRLFVLDLKECREPPVGRACRSVLFLDTYETLWTGREGGKSAQARLLDEWVRSLASYGLGSGILLVIAGRERLAWGEDDSGKWGETDLKHFLLGGLSAHDAQLFLGKCDVGPSPDEPASPLQEAIIRCCNTEAVTDNVVSCYPLYLALLPKSSCIPGTRTKGLIPP